MARKSRNKSPLMVMKDSDVEYRRRMLVRWDFTCIICGHGFTNLACVTREHIIPKSMIDHRRGISENLAPSHHQCNKARGTLSILAAAKHMEDKARTMHPVRFVRWLNGHVPHRIVPASALLPPRVTVPACLELPEFLPGMSWCF